MTFNLLKKQIELLRLRRIAARVVVLLYEAASNQADIDEINALFERCNHAHTRDDAQVAIDELIALAKTKDIPIDL